MNSVLRSLAFVGAITLAAVAHAQLQKATPDELARRGGGPPGSTAAPTSPPSTDPHNFAGVWRQPRGAAAANAATTPPGTGAAPVATALPTGNFDPNSNPEGNRGSAPGRLPDRILCMPQADSLYVGVDGPTLLTQTDDEIVWAAEEMHHIRRIFLRGGRTANLKPNFLGEAVGTWDGNTLVVETAGLKRLPAGAKLVERWTKSADGALITIEASNIDAQGQSIGAPRTLRLGWAGGQQVMEWMCEDYNEEWLPGGTDFDDQVAR